MQKNSNLLISIFIFSLILLPLCIADFVNLERIYNRWLAEQPQQQTLVQEVQILLSSGTLSEKFFTQNLDHFNPVESRTFQQRYFVNKQFYKSGGPVFLYIGGEAELRAGSVASGPITDLAREHNGLIFGLEHRYYGVSHPFANLSSENLVYLSSQQALHDLANFIRYMNSGETGDISQDISDMVTKWVVIGGSYPGNLSAWFRLKFPHLAIASWASSAPVRAKADFFEYDQVVAAQLGHSCSQYVRSVNQFLESELNTRDSYGKRVLKKLFHPNMDQVKDDVSFLYVLADIIAYAVQYDNPGVSLREKLCDSAADLTETEEMTKDDAIHRFAHFTRYFFDTLGTTPLEMDVTSYTRQTINDPSENMRQWMWQSCAEFGYWQSSPSSNTLRSKLITAEWNEKVICEGLFGFPPGYHVPVDKTNAIYGSLDIVKASDRILFSNGNRDPWKALGIQVELKFQQERQVEQSRFMLNHEIGQVRSIMIENVGHCADLRTVTRNDPASLVSAREQIFKQLNQWIRE